MAIKGYAALEAGRRGLWAQISILVAAWHRLPIRRHAERKDHENGIPAPAMASSSSDSLPTSLTAMRSGGTAAARQLALLRASPANDVCGIAGPKAMATGRAAASAQRIFSVYVSSTNLDSCQLSGFPPF